MEIKHKWTTIKDAEGVIRFDQLESTEVFSGSVTYLILPRRDNCYIGEREMFERQNEDVFYGTNK